MLNRNDILEFQIYGWFAHTRYSDDYCFILGDEKSTIPIAAKVNQIPPDYCHLDPTCRYDQFKSYKYVVFWSHWELAEDKMIEFFEDSQRDHFGKVIVKADRRPLLFVVQQDDITSGRVYLTGAFSDGWMKKESKFLVSLPTSCQSLVIEMMVPENPNDSGWQLTGSVSLGDMVKEKTFALQPGLHKLVLKFPPVRLNTLTELHIKLGKGFYYHDISDPREFRAHLRSISW